MDHQKFPVVGYSPSISAELFIHERRFVLASLGPRSLSLQAPEAAPPGDAVIRMLIDARTFIYHIEMVDGIDPQTQDQPFRLLSRQDEEAA